jgi:hypothetical protein
MPFGNDSEYFVYEGITLTSKLGGCMVGWTNFRVTQSTFLLPRCDSYDHILL